MLVDDPELRLRVVAGARGLDRPIGWAHVTELADPTPFLEGGEFLLTTGLKLPRRASPAHRSYVELLAGAGLAGLGFGTGLTHTRVPHGIVDAAESMGFPVLEVPLATPFIAVTKAVWAARAAEEHDLSEGAYRAQLKITRAAAGPDAQARLLVVLARELDAWTMLVDGEGALVHAEPSGAGRYLEAVRAQSRQLRESGNRGVVIGTLGDDEVVMQALRGPGRSGRSLLVVGRPTPLSPTDRQVVNAAASLLAVTRHRIAEAELEDSRLRSAAFRLFAGRHAEAAYYLAAQLDIALPREPVTLVVIVGCSRQLAELARSVESAHAESAEPMLLDNDPPGRLVVVLTSDGRLHRQLRGLLGRFEELATATVQMASVSDLPGALRQADDAARAGLRRGAPGSGLANTGGGSLLDLLAHADGRGFAESLLLPLSRYDASGRGDLLRSLSVWLRHNGHLDAAATELGVHRHTLRYRIRKVADLLGRDLDSAGTRMELWAALEIVSDRHVGNHTNGATDP